MEEFGCKKWKKDLRIRSFREGEYVNFEYILGIVKLLERCEMRKFRKIMSIFKLYY